MHVSSKYELMCTAFILGKLLAALYILLLLAISDICTIFVISKYRNKEILLGNTHL